MKTPVTWLYVPGDRPERFTKALACGADVVIIDLEDAVSPGKKDEARNNVARHAARGRPAGGPAVHVRVNDLGTARGLEDLRVVCGLPGIDAVRLPKIESTDALGLFAEIDARARGGGQDGERGGRAWPLLESPLGLANAFAIARHPGVGGMALGEQDLAAALSITSEAAFDHLRCRAVLAAAAAGLPPVPMSVFPDLRDEAGLIASCRHGQGLGMFGRSALHPRQLHAIRAGFSPSEQEVRWASRVVEAAERAGQTGAGAVAMPDGQFVDMPVVARARSILALAAPH